MIYCTGPRHAEYGYDDGVLPLETALQYAGRPSTPDAWQQLHREMWDWQQNERDLQAAGLLQEMYVEAGVFGVRQIAPAPPPVPAAKRRYKQGSKRPSRAKLWQRTELSLAPAVLEYLRGMVEAGRAMSITGAVEKLVAADKALYEPPALTGLQQIVEDAAAARVTKPR